MDWITVVLIGIGALVLIAVLAVIAWVIVARAAFKNFQRASKRMDDDFRNFTKTGRF